MRPGVNEVRLTVERRLVAEDGERVLAAVRLARAHADVVIVYQHDHYWEDDIAQVPRWKREFARECVDAGAVVFVSHGVPRLQGVEIYRGAILFFACGIGLIGIMAPRILPLAGSRRR